MWNNFDNSLANVSSGILNDSRNSNDETKKTAKSLGHIVPVMIRHILQSNQDLQIWDKTVHHITFMGVVRYMDKTSTKITYEIEDETDKITAFRWLEAGRTTEEPSRMLNTYVRIYGCLRQQNEKKYILVLKILPVTDLNEVTSHLLEVVHLILKLQGKLHNKGQTSNTTTTNDISKTNEDNLNGLSKEQALIFKIINTQNHTKNGMDRDTIRARVPKSILQNIDDIIEFLTIEGHIYTTVTDDHFKTT